MNRRLPPEVAQFKARELDVETARFCRTVTTFFEFHKGCPFRVCRRAGACATRNVVCYQMLEEEMKPIMQSVAARHWAWCVERGEELDVAPARIADMTRLLAWEEREIARIGTGERGEDDSGLSPYERWLRMVAREEADARSPAASVTPSR